MKYATILAFIFTACGTQHIQAEREIGVKIKQGPPCRVQISADGEVVSKVEGPFKCEIEDKREE